MPKKKILHIIQSLDSGGCENMLLRTLPLLNDDFEHQIVTLKELGELTPKFVASGITVKTVHCNSLFDVPGILRLQKLVQEECPDVILTYLFHADMISRFFLRNIPLSCHSELVEESHFKKENKTVPIIPFLRTTYNHPKYLIARILEWTTKPLVRQYLANSEAVKDFYVNHLGVQPEKITVIPNGIDVEYFDSITPDPELRKSLGINPDDFVIICIANLHPNKGHRYLLEAFEFLSLRAERGNPSPPPTHGHPGLDPGSIPALPKQNLKLLIVGDGIERENIEQQIGKYQSKENIYFLGRRTDVPQLLKISDCFVLPTLFEGMSNAVMEAMASGLPVITTDIPENRILIKNNISGILVPASDSGAITQAINTLTIGGSLSDKLRKSSHGFLEQSFSLKVSANSFHQFLNSL